MRKCRVDRQASKHKHCRFGADAAYHAQSLRHNGGRAVRIISPKRPGDVTDGPHAHILQLHITALEDMS